MLQHSLTERTVPVSVPALKTRNSLIKEIKVGLLN